MRYDMKRCLSSGFPAFNAAGKELVLFLGTSGFWCQQALGAEWKHAVSRYAPFGGRSSKAVAFHD